jgi:hypothetical protein
MPDDKKYTLRDRIYAVMFDGVPRTRLQIAKLVGREMDSPGLAAKVRDLRKAEHGGHTILPKRDAKASKEKGYTVNKWKLIPGEPTEAQLELTQQQDGQGLLWSGADEGQLSYQREQEAK